LLAEAFRQLCVAVECWLWLQVAVVAGHTGMTGGPCVGAVTDYVSTARRGGGR